MRALYQHPDVIAGLAQYLLETAWENLRKQKHTDRPERRIRKRGVTLQPGVDTPVWNELVRQAVPYLRKRGDKVRLARLLGISRQRLHQLLVARTACADAERTLLLLAWLQSRRSGREWV
ncbi:MAG: hypothetical protein RL091_1657 [Verrucomicrobiota bacterium]|jgi:hypothetical protein